MPGFTYHALICILLCINVFKMFSITRLEFLDYLPFSKFCFFFFCVYVSIFMNYNQQKQALSTDSIFTAHHITFPYLEGGAESSLAECPRLNHSAPCEEIAWLNMRELLGSI